MCQCSWQRRFLPRPSQQTQYQLGFSPSQALRVSGSTTGSGCKFSALMRASSRSWPVSCACTSLNITGKTTTDDSLNREHGAQDRHGEGIAGAWTRLKQRQDARLQLALAQNSLEQLHKQLLGQAVQGGDPASACLLVMLQL